MGALMRLHPLLKPLPLPELHSARLNHLLGALPDVDFDVMARHLEPITLRWGESIYEPGCPLNHAIFPTTSACGKAIRWDIGRETLWWWM